MSSPASDLGQGEIGRAVSRFSSLLCSEHAIADPLCLFSPAWARAGHEGNPGLAKGGNPGDSVSGQNDATDHEDEHEEDPNEMHGEEADHHDDGEEDEPPSDTKADVKSGQGQQSPSGKSKRKAEGSANADDSPKKTKTKKASK